MRDQAVTEDAALLALADSLQAQADLTRVLARRVRREREQREREAAAKPILLDAGAKHLTLRDVAARLGVRRASIWAWRQQGHFPEPDMLLGGSTRNCRWLLSTIEKWEQEQQSQGSTAA